MCGSEGQFSASPEEISSYAAYFGGDKSIQEKGLLYRGNKFVVLQASDESVLAMCKKEGFVMERSNRLIVIGYVSDTDRLPPQRVSASISKVVSQLKQHNY